MKFRLIFRRFPRAPVAAVPLLRRPMIISSLGRIDGDDSSVIGRPTRPLIAYITARPLYLKVELTNEPDKIIC